MTALRKQFYGYSAGLSAFYASIIRSRRQQPSTFFDWFLMRSATSSVGAIISDQDNCRMISPHTF